MVLASLIFSVVPPAFLNVEHVSVNMNDEGGKEGGKDDEKVFN